MKTGYLAPEGLEKALLRELKNVDVQIGRLIVADGGEQDVHWVQNVWRDLQMIHFDSVGNAAKNLRALGRLWANYSHENRGRARLIQEKLPYFCPRELLFPAAIPKGALGSWLLLDRNTIVASADCSSAIAHGEYLFRETTEPPSRAYLKLWEAFTRLGCMPGAGDVCLELGASPGSWTWVLSGLGAKVIAVDKAPLAGSFPNVKFLKKDAFQLEPGDFPEVSWVFSDVVCYPEKLLSWIKPWLQRKVNFICTLKFQGAEGYEVIEEFKKIAGGQIMHLFHNKHELTFVLLR
jgi:23S rRNA (cytidine2498-2'-O)-methyltransferase